MKQSTLAALGMPVAAALAVGALLLILHRSPSATPAASPGRPASAAGAAASGTRASTTSCAERKLAFPFTGIAVNPPLVQADRSFTRAASVRPRVVEFYNAFGRPFQKSEAEQVIRAGALPLIQLNPRHLSLSAIAAGHYDAYLRRYATAAKDIGCPVALSFGHEMNGSWYSWGSPRTSAATFIAAWRHIHRIFAARQARNVIWSWDPDHAGTPASGWWPGSAYVNWVGLDGYQRAGQTFASIFARQYNIIRSFTTKPVFIAETAVAPGPDQARQILGLFSAVRKYRLSGVVWFDINRKEQWRLEGDPAGLSAFRTGAARASRET